GNGQSGNAQIEGGARDSATDVASPITADTACSEMAAAQCANFATCPYVLTVLYGALDRCLTRMKINCMSLLSAPGSGQTPALVQQCTSLSKNKGCAQYNLPASCSPAGTLADSKPCWIASQCA